MNLKTDAHGAVGNIIPQHLVVDAYDGCYYTFGMSHAVAPGQPKWLRFDFEHSQRTLAVALFRPYDWPKILVSRHE